MAFQSKGQASRCLDWADGTSRSAAAGLDFGCHGNTAGVGNRGGSHMPWLTVALGGVCRWVWITAPTSDAAVPGSVAFFLRPLGKLRVKSGRRWKSFPGLAERTLALAVGMAGYH